MEQSEFMFVPNLSDASPRVAAEALLRDVPVIMNRHIAGGWKYINEQTGVFFDGVDDFWPAVQRLRALRAAGKLRPHDWFRCGRRYMAEDPQLQGQGLNATRYY